MIVGNRGGTNIAESFSRSAGLLGADVIFFEARKAQSRSPLFNSLLWRLNDKRPWAMPAFCRELVDCAVRQQPDFLVTTGLVPVPAELVHALRQQGIICLHFSTDDPWNPSQRAKWFLRSLPVYDIIFSARQSNLSDFHALGCRDVRYLPFAYDESIFKPRSADQAGSGPDVLFVGGADQDRVEFVSALIAQNISVALVGGYWGRYTAMRRHALGQKTPDELIALTQAAKVNLCLVRRANRDGHVMRSFEIAALGGCMLVEDTPEHRIIFGLEGECVFYFDGPQQAAAKIKMLLADNSLCRRLGAAVQQRIVAGGNTYTHRLQTLLQAAQDFKPNNRSLMQ